MVTMCFKPQRHYKSFVANSNVSETCVPLVAKINPLVDPIRVESFASFPDN